MTPFAIFAFLFAGCFLAYSLFGYPLLLTLLARLRSRPLLKDDERRSVTIVLPVYNGEEWIAAKLKSIAALDYPRDWVETLVISDGSEDRTVEIASRFPDVRVISAPKRGKAAAITLALPLARSDILFFTDVRQSLDPNCLRELVACFADPDVGGVCGELMISNGATEDEQSVGLYWRIEKQIRRKLSGMGTLLVVTGAVYATRRALAEPLPAGALGDDILMPQAILRKGKRVVLNPDAKAFDYPISRRMEFSRKARTLAALFQFLRQYGLGAYPFHFFSYKITRLLMPYMLLLAFAATFFLPPPFAGIALGAQIAFYAAAAIDNWIPDKLPGKRVSATARTFCMLMLASLWAASVMFVPSSQLWKTTRVNTRGQHS